MPHRVWRPTCQCQPGVITRGTPLCSNCNMPGEPDGWSLSMIESMGRYQLFYGLSPIGPHRKLADRIFDKIVSTCESCRGRGLRDSTTMADRYEGCPTCRGFGRIFTAPESVIESVRQQVLAEYPNATADRGDGFISATPTKKSTPPLRNQAGLGNRVLQALSERLQIDEEWSIREPCGSTWWAHRLAQRVWIEQISEDRDSPVVQVQAETALLCQVPDTMANRARLNLSNKAASLNTYRFDPQTGRLTLRCCAYVTPETERWLTSFLSAAVAIQIADAHIKGQSEFARLFDAEVDVSSHPSSGRREVMDDMLNVIEKMFAPMGQRPSPFTEADFESLTHISLDGLVLTNADSQGVTTEFRFNDEKPGLFSGGTALCEIIPTSHPQLGNGVLWKLTLPLYCTEREAIDKAIELNLAEYDYPIWPYFYGFGGWCSDQRLRAVAYIMFMPAAVYKPGILVPFFLSMRARTEWAKLYLTGTHERHGSA
ncbi:MAG: hypothetical protein OJF51_002204 [Nitrospira sp.]|nr:MAG: hypothetical protein OJF51_002204 [Nitrospira sp.]